MKNIFIYLLIIFIITISVSGCILCKQAPDARFEFRLVNANGKDIFLQDITYHLDSLKIQSLINSNYPINFSKYKKYSSNDSFYVIPTNITYNEKIIIQTKLNRLDTVEISTATDCSGRCGCGSYINYINHKGKKILPVNNIFYIVVE